MSPLDLALLGVTALLTAAMTAVIGFGGGVILIGVILLFVPPAVAIPIHGLVQIVSNAWRLFLFRRHIFWPICLRFTALLPVGIALGIWFFQGLSAATVQVLIGSFVLLSLFTRKLRRFRGRDLPLWSFWPLGFVAGILNIMVGVVAVALGPLVIRKELAKQQLIATIAYLSASGHVGKVIAFGLTGFSFQRYLLALAVMIPAVMLGGNLGKWLLGYVSDQVFLVLFQVLLVALALKLIVWEGLLKLI